MLYASPTPNNFESAAKWTFEMAARFALAATEIDRLRARIAELEESLEAAEAALAYYKAGEPAQDLAEAVRQLREADARVAELEGERGRC